MRILGLDTATRRTSIGLLIDGEVVAEQAQDDGRHAIFLLPLIEQVLGDGNCTVQMLDAIAVSAGPGSFTGLRIGLSVSKGLACATGLPLVAVPTLEALARTVEGHGIICAVLDARKGEVYTACFEHTARGCRRLTDDQVTTPEVLVASLPTPCTVVGDAVPRYGELLQARLGRRATILPWETCGPRGATVAALGAERLRDGLVADLANLEPFYIRPPEAVTKVA